MAFQEYVGAIVLEVDGQEIEIVSLTPKRVTGREPATAMSSKGRIVGYSEGITMFSLDVTALIPVAGDPIAWGDIVGARITVQPQAGGTRTSYINCVSTSVGREFKVNGQAAISISMFAEDEITE